MLANIPPNVIFGSDTEALNVNIEGDGLGGAKLIHSITGETGTTLEHVFPSNHFASISQTDRNNVYGRQFLVLKDDGDVGFEYIKVQDVFKNSDFVFDISSLKVGTSNDFTTSKSTLIGTNSAGTTLADLGSEFKVTYAGSPSPGPVSAKISSNNFVGGFAEYDLSDPYTTLSTDDLFVSYPTQSDESINITVRATGSDSNSDTATFKVNFPNNTYFGVTGQNVSGSDLSSSGFTQELKRKTELGNGKLQLSLAGGFSTPIGNYTTGGLNDLGQRATILEGRALIHYHWHTGWFATFQSGYSYKSKPT